MSIDLDQRTIPTVNLNGTLRSELVKHRVVAAETLRMVLPLLGAAAPHGRDYLARDADLAYARRLHEARWNIIEGMIEQFMAEAEAIAAQ